MGSRMQEWFRSHTATGPLDPTLTAARPISYMLDPHWSNIDGLSEDYDAGKSSSDEANHGHITFPVHWPMVNDFSCLLT